MTIQTTFYTSWTQEALTNKLTTTFLKKDYAAIKIKNRNQKRVCDKCSPVQ